MHREEIQALPTFVQDYLRYISVIKNKSQTTVSEYATDLRTFFRFIKKSRGLVNADIPFEEISISDLDVSVLKSVSLNDAYEFLYYCKNERGNEAASRARKTSTLRSFFSYMTQNKNMLETDPMVHLDSPKLKKTLPKYLSVDESIRLLGAVDGKFKERDYCMITLFLNCGLRLSELVSLNISAIKSDNRITVLGKGNKERSIYLNSACVSALQAYLAVRPHDCVVDRDALFLSNRKKRISPKTVQYVIKSYLDKIGLSGSGYSTHKLRHTAATLMYQSGNVDILSIKEILGHENLNTTQIYTHTRNDELRDAVNQNPLAGLQAPVQKDEPKK